MTYVILDTNTLLLFLVGTTNLKYIQKHKRTDQFTEENFKTLLEILPSDSVIIYPPHVAAEVSNLIDYASNEIMKIEIFENFSKFINLQNEISIKSINAIKDDQFIKLGLTDSTLLLLSEMKHAGKKAHLITADLKLAIAAEIRGYDVTNFNHLLDC
ncbi:PIN domain-containing protein [Acetobacter pasteurianus]|uniref:PIN domain-containing protein n=1 Tax=Acetobacter pasteurianus NBRC 3188 TaxID=1226663 RepID=A0A401WRW2_ACEPA|nr:hypothetical protein [Acetobacter pasteurianus]GCD52027.1 hypothetical protein NBRC3188_0724 [Acetobacter pasteurianus NBRC 3188]